MNGVLRDRTGPLFLWVLIATIFAHALLPTGSALVRTMGSAFSASTADVSLAPSRKATAASARQNQAPDADTGTEARTSHIPLPSNPIAGPDGVAGEAIRIASQIREREPAVPASSVQARAPPRV